MQTAAAGRRSTWRRVGSAIEVVVFLGSILAFMWRVQPATGTAAHLVYYLLVLAFLVVSAALHRESWRTLGLRFDNLPAAVRLVLPPTFAIALVVAGVAWALGVRWKVGDALAILPIYYVWALVQQYALQAFVQRRLWNAGVERTAPVLAAALFAVAHLPNPALVVLTFVAGWMWAAFYRRVPSLFVLALSHALLAAVLATALPHSFTGGLHVGPGYWRH